MKTVFIGVSVLAIAIVVAFIYLGIQSRAGSAPGISAMQLQACTDKPNCVFSDAAADSAAYIAPLTFAKGQEDATWVKLVDSISAEGGDITMNAPPYLAATFRSKLFGFVDDLECLIDQDEGVVHIRAGARVGHSDLDVNRKRVERLREGVSH
ncbi:MAG: hypothetical protein ACI9BW_001676 [Gammaproteobacteria bacterium]|jgi:uncharacterized protein (DUF1499 family)